MRVGITGASGLIGTALSDSLLKAGHAVVPFVRRPPSTDEIGWNPATGRLDPAALDGVDAVIHLAGAPIGDKRWTDRRKQQIRESRVLGTTLVAQAIVDSGAPKVLLSASAIGYYGNRPDGAVDEQSLPGEGFAASVAVDWERSTDVAEQAGVRVAHFRTGIVLTPKGGALRKMLPLFKLGIGGRFGKGTQWMSWISLDDEVRAIEHLLSSTMVGPVNLTAPHPVRNSEFATTLAGVLNRPAVLPVPRFGPALLFGRELADELVFGGQCVTPAKLIEDGFTFSHPELEPALRHMLSR